MAFQKTVFMEKSARNVAVKKEAGRLKLGPKIWERQSRALTVQEAPGAGLLSEIITLKTNMRLRGSQRSRVHKVFRNGQGFCGCEKSKVAPAYSQHLQSCKEVSIKGTSCIIHQTRCLEQDVL